MRSLCTLVLLLAALQLSYAQKTILSSKSNTLAFLPNAGQITDQYSQARTDIDFRLSAAGVNVFIGKGSLHYQWAKPVGKKVVGQDSLQEIATYRMDVQLLGANPNAILVKEHPTAYYERYYTPQFGAEGGLAQSYARITYKNIYPHIDWTLYVKNNQVEYDFVVHPGGKVSDIQLQYAGASALSINKDGSLSAQTPFGSVTEAAPYSFQEDGKSVASTFTRHNNILSFEVGHYEGTLVIDPVLEWGTYYGGSLNDEIPIGCIAADAWGDAYFTGHTTSTQNIATTGSHQNTISLNSDIFLVKFNNAGQRIWATYYGGTGGELASAVATDKTGQVYVAGQSNSQESSNPNFASASAHQTLIGGGNDAFLVKFDSSGVRQWATYYGGTGADQAFGLCIDTSNNIIMSGLSSSTTNIATVGAYKEINSGGNDAFIVKFNPQGQRLWGTYFGGTSTEYSPALAIDPLNNIVLAGYTQSNNNIASTTAHQSTLSGTRDAFVAKFDSSGGYSWSSYFGSTGAERLQSVCTDAAGGIYLAGDTETGTTNISYGNSHQSTYGGGASDGFACKFTSTGQLAWSTYAGGSQIDRLNVIKYHPDGFVYAIGYSNSTNNILFGNNLQGTLTGGHDVVIQKYDTSGNLVWSTYWGGEGSDMGNGLAVGNNNTLFIAGSTASATGIASPNAHQAVHGGSSKDGFIAMISDCDLNNNNAISGADTICQGISYTYTTNTVPGAQACQWLVPNGWQGNSTTNSIDIVAHGADDSLGLAIIFACGTTDTIYYPISVIALPTINPSSTVHSCAGDSILLTAGNADNYQWLQDGQVIPNAGQAALMVSTDGAYQVVSTNSLGCSDTSLATNVHFHALPTPVITANGNVLSTGPYASYQWQHNGNDITGATQQDYTFSINTGAYTVRVVDSNGCTGISAPFTAGVGIAPGADADNIIVYPNPTQDFLYVQAQQPLQLYLNTIDGRTVSKSANTTIDMSGLAQGVYILYAYDNKGTLLSVHKVIKTASQ